MGLVGVSLVVRWLLGWLLCQHMQPLPELALQGQLGFAAKRLFGAVVSLVPSIQKEPTRAQMIPRFFEPTSLAKVGPEGPKRPPARPP
ncbi:MAG: hypothetical protein EBX49_07015 [Synechococcaceae bacterium WB8_1B_136]|nr:hypothetical protein [Synechococcaceae bacterium WB8_1B_136]